MSLGLNYLRARSVSALGNAASQAAWRAWCDAGRPVDDLVERAELDEARAALAKWRTLCIDHRDNPASPDDVEDDDEAIARISRIQAHINYVVDECCKFEDANIGLAADLAEERRYSAELREANMRLEAEIHRRRGLRERVRAWWRS